MYLMGFSNHILSGISGKTENDPSACHGTLHGLTLQAHLSAGSTEETFIQSRKWATQVHDNCMPYCAARLEVIRQMSYLQFVWCKLV